MLFASTVKDFSVAKTLISLSSLDICECSRKEHCINFNPEPCEDDELTCFGVSARWELSHRTYFYAGLTKKTTNASRMPRSRLRSCLLSRLEAALKQREMLLDCVYIKSIFGD